MKSPDNFSTAILIFTRNPQEEAVSKKFISRGGKKGNEIISRQLIHATIRKARKCSLPYHVIYSNHQKGETFGERITNAISEIFKKGYENVIAIGNDAPQLSPQLLEKAAKEFERHDIVLGPDHRGGVFLLGISKKYFSENTFQKFSWNTPFLHDEILNWSLHSELEVTLLPQLTDVNYYWDLKRILSKKEISLSFLRVIASIIASNVIPANYHSPLFCQPGKQISIPRRGPPPLSMA